MRSAYVSSENIVYRRIAGLIKTLVFVPLPARWGCTQKNKRSSPKTGMAGNRVTMEGKQCVPIQ